MSTRGRKPTPTHLKLVRGNPGKRKIGRGEPTPKIVPCPPPSFLSDDAKVEWGRVSEQLEVLGMLTVVDRAALAAYCQAYGRWALAERELAKVLGGSGFGSGLLYIGANSRMCRNPLITIANEAMRDMVKFSIEFGMTPSSRSRIHVPENTREQDPAEAFFS